MLTLGRRNFKLESLGLPMYKYWWLVITLCLFFIVSLTGRLESVSALTTIGYAQDEISGLDPNHRKFIVTSDGTLHLFTQASSTLLNICTGASSTLLWFYSFDDGANWECQGIGTSSPTANYYFSSAVADDNDNIFLASSVTTNVTTGPLNYTKLTKSGSTWTVGTTQVISDYNANRANIEIDDDGLLWISFLWNNNGNKDLAVIYSDGTGDAPNWTLSKRIVSNANVTHQTSNLLRLSDRTVVLFNDVVGTDLYYVEHLDTDPLDIWSDPALAALTSSTSFVFSSVVADDDSIHTIYGLNGSSNTDVKYTWFNGTSWSAPIDIKAGTIGSGTENSITTDGTNVYLLEQNRPTTSLNGMSTLLGRYVYYKISPPYGLGQLETLVPVVPSDNFFSGVYFFDSSVPSYTNQTSAMSVTSVISIPDQIGDILYFGYSDTFRSVAVKTVNAGATGILEIEYWNGASWVTMPDLTSNNAHFRSGSNYTEYNFLIPEDWETIEIDAVDAPGTRYYVRARVTTSYTTTPTLLWAWNFPEQSHVMIPKKFRGLLPIAWSERISTDTGNVFLQFQSFSFNAEPNSPSSLTGPTANRTASNQPSLGFTLSDSDSGDQVQYLIQIDDTSDFSSPVVSFTSDLASQGIKTFVVGQSSGTYSVGSTSQILSDGDYYWRVKTIDEVSAESEYTLGSSFEIDTTSPTTPGTPNLSNTNLVLRPTWTWTASTDSGVGLKDPTYQVEWCTNINFTNCSSNITTTNATSWQPSTNLDEGTWYVRVKAFDQLENESSYSTSTAHSIDVSAPSVPILKSPSHNSAVNNARPTFRWEVTNQSDVANFVFNLSYNGKDYITINNIPSKSSGTKETKLYKATYKQKENGNTSISLTFKKSNSWTIEENYGKLRSGKNTWKVVVYDLEGNSDSISRKIFLDKNAPTIKVLVNQQAINIARLTNTEAILISGTIEDKDVWNNVNNKRKNLKTVSLEIFSLNQINNEPIYKNIVTFSEEDLILKNNNYTALFNASIGVLPEGYYLIRITSSDLAGNLSTYSHNLLVNSSVTEPIKDLVEKEFPMPSSPIPQAIPTVTSPPALEPNPSKSSISKLKGFVSNIFSKLFKK